MAGPPGARRLGARDAWGSGVRRCSPPHLCVHVASELTAHGLHSAPCSGVDLLNGPSRGVRALGRSLAPPHGEARTGRHAGRHRVLGQFKGEVIHPLSGS